MQLERLGQRTHIEQLAKRKRVRTENLGRYSEDVLLRIIPISTHTNPIPILPRARTEIERLANFALEQFKHVQYEPMLARVDFRLGVDGPYPVIEWYIACLDLGHDGCAICRGEVYVSTEEGFKVPDACKRVGEKGALFEHLGVEELEEIVEEVGQLRYVVDRVPIVVLAFEKGVDTVESFGSVFRGKVSGDYFGIADGKCDGCFPDGHGAYR